MRSEIADGIIKRIKKRKTPYNIRILNTNITVLKDVYPPEKDSVFLAEQLTNKKYGVKKGEYVLDYGCGTGFLGIVAAKLGAEVIAIDMNKQAIKNTKVNIKNNSVEDKVDVRIGFSFEAIKPNEKFDLILASLPFEQAKPKEPIEYSVYDANFQMRKALFNNAKKFLTNKGRILFNYSERTQNIKPIQSSSDDFEYRLIARKIIYGEPYIIFLITLKN